MQASTIPLVRDTWQQAAALGPQVGALFYANLFAADPALQALFKGDMAQQGARLVQMIGTAVDRLDDPDTLLPVLRQLGQRHAGYGVLPAHYQTVGAALLQTLQQGLGSGFTPPVQAAWTEVYGVLSTVMLAGAASATPA
jgi:methyl-accepting chemotaxis protein